MLNPCFFCRLFPFIFVLKFCNRDCYVGLAFVGICIQGKAVEERSLNDLSEFL
jgi:hypothetical protein